MPTSCCAVALVSARSYAVGAAKGYATRARGYLQSGPGGVNLERLGTYLLIGGALYLGYQLYKKIRAPYDSAKDLLGKGADAAAHVIVGNPMQTQDGLFYVLPNGTKVASNSSSVQYLGSMLFKYLGVKYKLVEALGGGYYRAEKA